MYKRHSLFYKSLEEYGQVQSTLLKGILGSNKTSKYGMKYDFSKIDTIRDFQERVPVVNYEDIKAYIEEMKNGEENVLTTNKVLLFEKTSGSSSSSKFIPFTKELLAEIGNATSAWIYDVFEENPKIMYSTSYWSITPSIEEKEYTPCGIPVSTEDDSEYFSWYERIFLKQLLAIDSKEIFENPDNFREVTAVGLLKDEYLGLISIWSPTFLLILLDYIETNSEALLIELEKVASKKRYKLLKEELNKEEITYNNIWPNLTLVSCWADGPSRSYKNMLANKLDFVKLQDKGLFMTEGIITFPIEEAPGPVLAINSHFFEFEEVKGSKRILLASEVVAGEKYIPIITTSGGLYRYKTGDVVEIVGRYNKVPCLRFIGRSDNVVDLFGEKLNEVFVQESIDKVDEIDSYVLLAPVMNPRPHYGLFVDDGEVLNELVVARKLEVLLCGNHHYQLCRKLNQLERIQVYKISNFQMAYEKIMSERGIKSGNIKPKFLDSSNKWERLATLA